MAENSRKNEFFERESIAYIEIMISIRRLKNAEQRIVKCHITIRNWILL